MPSRSLTRNASIIRVPDDESRVTLRQSLPNQYFNLAIGLSIALAHLVHADPTAAEEPRLWSDRSGKFSVQATLVTQSGNIAVLQKIDGTEVKVPIDRLSDEDQKFLASSSDQPMLQTDYQPPTLPADGKEVSLNVTDRPGPLIPDPRPLTGQTAPFTRSLQQIDAYSRLSEPIALSKTAFAVSLYRKPTADSKDGAARIYSMAADSKNAEVRMELNQSLRLLDHERQSGQTLAMLGSTSLANEGGELVLMSGLPQNNPVVMGRATVPLTHKTYGVPEVHSARLVANNIAIVHVDSLVYVWSLQNGQLLFKTQNGVNQCDVSGTGKYLAVGVRGGVVVIDVAKAEAVMRIDFPAQVIPDVGFSPDGKTLAIMGGKNCRFWDLATATLLIDSGLDSGMGTVIGWVNDQYVLTLGGLIDAATGQRVWTYRWPPTGDPLILDGAVALTDTNPVASVSVLPVPHRRFDRMTDGRSEPGESVFRSGRWIDSDGGPQREDQLPPVEPSGQPTDQPKPNSNPSGRIAIAASGTGGSGFNANVRGLELLEKSAIVNELPHMGRELFFAPNEFARSLVADPSTESPPIVPMHGLVEATTPDGSEQSIAPVAVDYRNSTYAVSVHENNLGTGSYAGRLYLATPGDNGEARIRGPILSTDKPLYLTDYRPQTGLSLAQFGDDLIVMRDVAPESPTVVARWHLPLWQRNRNRMVDFARWVGDEHVVAQIHSNLYCWSLVTGELHFKLEKFLVHRVTVSGGGRTLAVSNASRDGLGLIDVANAEPIGRVLLDNSLIEEMYFSPDGQKLATSFGNQLIVYDLASAEIIVNSTIDKKGNLLGWVDDELLLTTLAGLFRLDSDERSITPVWQYQIPLLNAATTPGGIVATTRSRGVNVMVLPVPHREGLLSRISSTLGTKTIIRDGQWNDR